MRRLALLTTLTALACTPPSEEAPPGLGTAPVDTPTTGFDFDWGQGDEADVLLKTSEGIVDVGESASGWVTWAYLVVSEDDDGSIVLRTEVSERDWSARTPEETPVEEAYRSLHTLFRAGDIEQRITSEGAFDRVLDLEATHARLMEEAEALLVDREDNLRAEAAAAFAELADTFLDRVETPARFEAWRRSQWNVDDLASIHGVDPAPGELLILEGGAIEGTPEPTNRRLIDQGRTTCRENGTAGVCAELLVMEDIVDERGRIPVTITNTYLIESARLRPWTITRHHVEFEFSGTGLEVSEERWYDRETWLDWR